MLAYLEPKPVAKVTAQNIRTALRGQKKDLVKKFIKFHEDHMDVYKLFYEYSMEMKETGRETYSSWVIANLIRWRKDTDSDDTTEFKINNNFIGLYARLLMARHEELEGFFVIRKTKG